MLFFYLLIAITIGWIAAIIIEALVMAGAMLVIAVFVAGIVFLALNHYEL